MSSPPPPEVVAAIVAAVEVAWPRPPQPAEDPRHTSRWRFSNRWWVPRRGQAAPRPRP
ncbi:MAG: hypothetical protein KY454_03965 [Actinobacteria bacterium]|nr:hypothetical protein [Actinomycetota bacterium]MBW3650042.1 hypothetical protein [Actinomycetota bacterium]